MTQAELQRREHIQIDHESCKGFVIESVHHRDESILILFEGNKYTVIMSEGDEDWSYITTTHHVTAELLLHRGFTLDFIKQYRLLSDKDVEKYEIKQQEKAARKLAEEREQYEQLKAKFGETI